MLTHAWLCGCGCGCVCGCVLPYCRYRFGVAVGERPREAQVWYDDAAADATAYQASDYIPLAPALLANRYTTQLPAGDVNNGYTATVRVVVTDIFAASTQIATWVNVTRIIKADTQEELDTVVDTYATTIEQTLAVRRWEAGVVNALLIKRTSTRSRVLRKAPPRRLLSSSAHSPTW